MDDGCVSPDPVKLQKIVKVLMDQVERGIDFQGNAYSLFQTAILLEDKVRQRTRRLETALRELEESNHDLSNAKRQTETAQTRLMEAIESISEGFILFDRDDALVLCNSRFIEFWSGDRDIRDIREVMRPGISFRELSRWTVENGLVANLDGDPEAWLRDRLYRHSNPSDPIVVQLATGRWLQIRERQTQDNGIVGIYMDITDVKRDEQRRREQELAEKSMLLQSTLDHLVQGVSVFDRNMQLVAWNDRFLELLDLPDWLVRPGSSFDDHVRYRSARGDFGYESESALALRFEQIRRCLPAKSEEVLPDGTVLDVRRDPMSGGGFVMTYTDITERMLAAQQLSEAKETLERRVRERTTELTTVNAKLRQEIFERAEIEEALRQAKVAADEANQSKTRFLAAASHDLLQPLNAARLFVTALAERPLADKEAQFVSHIDRALGGVEGLLGTLLDISKLDAGAVTAEKTDFVVGDLLQQLAEEYQPAAGKEGVELRVVACSRVVHSDLALLGRVLRNFLTNAIRYTPSGRVLLGCRRRGDTVRIETHDTGLGIPDASVSEIFEEFRQLHGDRAQGKSFGLGLAIVKRIARVLDHPIGVRSVVGKGSAFWVDVPVGSLPPRALPKREVVPMPRDTLASALVAVIDDQESILIGMGELLRGWGCTPIVAVDGRTAVLDLARSERSPDIVIADYHLDGGATGVDAVEEIRDVYGCDVPGLIITADRSPKVVDIVRRHGFHLLRKPVKPAKLRALVSHMLAGRRSEVLAPDGADA
jgi:signal transduction histidine kinase/PAS domain-containing protein